ncbi:MAG TPA: hypothetical protein VKB51_10505 [bacterium]|nr:hypothetical protein [bacterium]
MQSKRIPFATAVLAVAAALLLLLPGCSSMGGESMSGSGMDSLTFQGDTSFHGPHGGQAIQVALVDADTGKVVAKQSGTVSKTADPAFSFTFNHVLKPDTHYDVDYWIDSNFGGGTPGHCDAKNHDHQWNVKLGEAYSDVKHVEHHRPAETSPVCDVFAKM